MFQMADLSVETLDGSVLNVSEVVVEATAPGPSVDPTPVDPGNPTHTSTPHKKLPRLCVTCGKTFKTSSHMHEHARLVHSAGKGARYLCKVCGKGFMAKTYLDSHLNWHDNKAPHNCQTCERVFQSLHCMRRHQKSCKGANVPPSFMCVDCDKTFATKDLLAQHRHIHDAKGMFRCLTCPKHYKYRSGLFRHSKSCPGM